MTAPQSIPVLRNIEAPKGGGARLSVAIGEAHAQINLAHRMDSDSADLLGGAFLQQRYRGLWDGRKAAAPSMVQSIDQWKNTDDEGGRGKIAFFYRPRNQEHLISVVLEKQAGSVSAKIYDSNPGDHIPDEALRNFLNGLNVHPPTAIDLNPSRSLQFGYADCAFLAIANACKAVGADFPGYYSVAQNFEGGRMYAAPAGVPEIRAACFEKMHQITRSNASEKDKKTAGNYMNAQRSYDVVEGVHYAPHLIGVHTHFASSFKHFQRFWDNLQVELLRERTDKTSQAYLIAQERMLYLQLVMNHEFKKFDREPRLIEEHKGWVGNKWEVKDMYGSVLGTLTATTEKRKGKWRPTLHIEPKRQDDNNIIYMRINRVDENGNLLPSFDMVGFKFRDGTDQYDVVYLRTQGAGKSRLEKGLKLQYQDYVRHNPPPMPPQRAPRGAPPPPPPPPPHRDPPPAVDEEAPRTPPSTPPPAGRRRREEAPGTPGANMQGGGNQAPLGQDDALGDMQAYAAHLEQDITKIRSDLEQARRERDRAEKENAASKADADNMARRLAALESEHNTLLGKLEESELAFARTKVLAEQFDKLSKGFEQKALDARKKLKQEQQRYEAEKEQHNKESDAKLDELRRQIRESFYTIEERTKLNEEFKGQRDEADSKRRLAKAERKVFEDERDAAKCAQKRAEERLNEAKEKHKGERAELRKQLFSMQESRNKAELALVSAESRNKGLEARLKHLEDLLKEKDKLISELQNTISGLRLELARLKNNVESKSKEVKDLESTIAAKKQKIKTLRQVHKSELEKEREEYEKEIDKVHEKGRTEVGEAVKAKSTAEAQLGEQITKLEEELTEALQEKKFKEHALEALEEKAQKQAEEITKLSEVKKKAKKTIGDLKVDLTSAEAREKVLRKIHEERCEALRKEAADAQKERRKLEIDLKREEERKEAAEAKNKELIDEVDAQKTKLWAATAANKTLQGKLEAQKGKTQEARSQSFIARSDAEIAEMEKEKAEKTARLAKGNSVAADLRASKAESEKKKLEADNKTLEESRKRWEGRIKELTDKLLKEMGLRQDAEAELAKIKREVDQVVKSLDDSDLRKPQKESHASRMRSSTTSGRGRRDLNG